MERKMSRKEEILWYIGRIIDHLTDAQAGAVIVMLKKFYRRMRDQ